MDAFTKGTYGWSAPNPNPSSIAAATRRTKSSSPCAAMICKPMGRRAFEIPHGIEIAGNPSAFIPRVNRVPAARTSSVTALITTLASPIFGAVIGVVGVNRQSTRVSNSAN